MVPQGTRMVANALISNPLGEHEPLNIVVNEIAFNAANATCSCCCLICSGVVSLSVTANPFTVPNGSATQLTATATYNSGSKTDVTSGASWSSNNTPVATVGAGLVSGVSPGSVTITATIHATIGGACRQLGQQCPLAAFACSLGGNAQPSVSITGPADVPLRNGSDIVGVNSITLSATGNPAGGTFNWTTTSSKVSLTNTSSATVTVTSVAASGTVGDVPITVTYTLNSESAQATQKMTVQKPTSLSIVSGTSSTTAEASCTVNAPGSPTGCGVNRTFTWQVLDQWASAMQFGGMQFWDSITLGSTNQLFMSSTFTTTCTGKINDANNGANEGPCGEATGPNGQFFEASPGLGVCSTVCYSNGSCVAPSAQTTAAQVYTVNGFATQANQLTFECNKILVNGN